MISEQKPLMQVLGRYARLLEARWKSLVGLILWAFIMLIIFFIGTMQLSERIQAASVITLVFITWYYAVQTQALVREEKRALEEERNKRVAEYGEKRISEFLLPLQDKLEALRRKLSIISDPRSKPLIDIWDNPISPIRFITYDDIKRFFFDKAYMADNICREMFYKFIDQVGDSWPTIDRQDDKYIVQWKEQIDKSLSRLTAHLGLQIQMISTHIQKTYGYYINVPLSWDDLLPPKEPPG